jgi:serine/threonine protein kinase/beta-lactam-binding protein with PASTA domain
LIEQQTFNNRYRLDRKLGEGGMATVYCGTDTLLRRRVAVKVLREQYAADEEFVRRFYQEAESAARLSHPNIVATYDVGREGRLYYIVMELVDGPSLAEIIAGDGRLPEPVAIDYAVQICSGLAYAHRQGLLHRDLKPANILVTKDDVVKLSDFGIARAVTAQTMALTKPGLVMGSVHYISPEQAQGHELHESSDLYSVGVVLFQMLTGRLPYSGESPVTVALKHISDPVPTIDTKDLGTSPALAAIVNKLLQKHPENRFRSASDVATALREARERPSRAAFAIHDDAPAKAFRAQDLPPRRSPLPDRPYSSISEEEERAARSSSRIITALVVLMLLATGIGYYAYGRQVPQLPILGEQVAVGQYKGMEAQQAQMALQNDHLVAKVTKTASDTVPVNQVFSQNPAPGTSVAANSVVELFVSNGLLVSGLLDVTGFTSEDAARILRNNKFLVKVQHKYASATKDTVIEQIPKAGSHVRQSATVTLVVSDGPPLKLVPSLAGMTVAQAQAVAAKTGFTLDTSASAASQQYAAGTIADQDVAPGTRIDRNANLVVHATVSSGAAPLVPTSVPYMIGHSYADALQMISDAGLKAGVVYDKSPGATGNVVSQQPDSAAGDVAQGSLVTIHVAIPGEVPDTQGMLISDARTLLASYGYPNAQTQYTLAEGTGGRVVRTVPVAGTPLDANGAITLIVNGTPP